MTSIVPKLLDYAVENDKTIYIVASKLVNRESC